MLCASFLMSVPLIDPAGCHPPRGSHHLARLERPLAPAIVRSYANLLFTSDSTSLNSEPVDREPSRENETTPTPTSINTHTFIDAKTDAMIL
jgi:hypothetical protein